MGYQYGFNSNSISSGINLKQVNNPTNTMLFGVYEILINNNVGNLYYNGTLIDTQTFPALGTFDKLVMGSRYISNIYNYFFKGEIYEILLLNTFLDDGDRYKVEKYLMDKWATTQICRTIPISNIYTWLDASSKNNFTLDANNNVLAWNDKNFNLNFTQSNSSFYPVFDTNKVIFNNSYLTMTDSTGLDLNNFSIFYIFEEITHNNNAGLLSCINTLGESDDQIIDGFALITPSINTIGLSINSLNLNYTDSTSLSKKLYEFNISNGVGILYINGVNQGTTNFSTLETGLQFVIGARQNNETIDTSIPLNANIYELIVLNTGATYEQRSQIYSYLTEKWNLPIIYTPAPNPTFWIDSNNNTSITVDINNNITAWSDLSSNQYPIIINNTQPVLTTVNNLKYASFNGSDLHIHFGNFSGNLTGNNLSLYLVFSASNLNNESFNRLISFNNGVSDFSDTSFNINSDQNKDTIMYNSSINFFETVKYNNSLYILSIQIIDNNVNIYINNYLVSTTTNSQNYNFATLDIGNLINGTNFWIGYINELILYTSSLDSNSNLGTIKYLAEKWSINIQSPNINEYLSRTSSTVTNTLQLNKIFTNSENYLTISNSIDKSSDININVLAPISSTQPNQLNIMTTDIIYLTSVDINTIYNVNVVVQNGVINLPVLSHDGDYFAFNNIGIYPFIVTGPNNLYLLIPINTPIYFTNIQGNYNISNNFEGFTCTLNQYNNNITNIFTVYLGGWSKSLYYIPSLYIYSNNNLLASTNSIYFNETNQADFTLEINPGTYNIVITDIKSETGNIISYDIAEPVVINLPVATLDHYNNGSSSYIITLDHWNSIYSNITTLDVWVSTIE
jgi:hypothetical protein